MDVLKTISDLRHGSGDDFRLREAARIVLLDAGSSVPLLFVAKHNYHKLPGGGVEKGEDLMAALRREALEEVGCKIRVDRALGKIIEFRQQYRLKQVSYCYFGKVIDKGEPQFTEEELSDGFELMWQTLDEAIRTLKRDDPMDYDGKFIRERDLTFLERAQGLLGRRSDPLP